ncbi:hemin-degrading factor [Kiloniella laminariae]|uniref:Hemin-degrading factor n=1 Tax=Kiloniella laminariae TaxID=454162 RepID=A0ABT4LM62_9PROT|nr:ChuX/HutX family heme-like substrate-binding protein [Kiloniella laminariae]MCZ4282193.1 hemin-degrading factor [Kiloniella laminariae]
MSQISATENTPHYDSLTAAWVALSEGSERRYARDLARDLDSSEAQLISAGCGKNAQKLEGDWGNLIQELGSLGEVKILTRNDHVVHEKVGSFDKISVRGPMGIVLNHDIDLRLFMSHWTFGFAVKTENGKGLRHSLQFFDAAGTAIHKVFLTEKSDHTAYKALVAKYRAKDQTTDLSITPYEKKAAAKPDATIDIKGLREAWAGMKDVHQFHAMLRQFECERHQSFRLIGTTYAEKLMPTALREVLEQAASEKISIMVFVGNKGCIQIHTGPVEKIRDMGPWINVLDPGFNLHLREDHIAEAWLVRKPTKDGNITTLELFDDQGESFALLCGEREAHNPENRKWQELVENLPRYHPLTEAAE